MILSGMKAEKTNTHAALFDKMKKVLRHLLGPHDAGLNHHFVVCMFEFNSDLCVGREDVWCPDEHSGRRDVLGKCHPVWLLNAKLHLETLFRSEEHTSALQSPC